MPRGGYRPNSGRKPGVKKRLRAECDEIIAITGEAPGLFLARKMREATDEAMQVECAKALMPYVHRKKPEAREVEVVGLPDTIHFVFE